MFCTPAEVSEQDDHDAVRRDGTGNGTVAFAVDQSGDRSLLLSDAGCDEFHPAELWHLSAVVSSGDLFVIRYDLSMIGFGTIGNMCFLGYISDFFRWLWSLLLPAGFFAVTANRYILLLPSLAIFLLGAAAYMCAGLGSSPYDALPFIISGHVRHLSFKVIRMTWDISFMAAGFLLGGDVGIVTILVAFFLGPIIAWMQQKLEVLIV